MRKVCRFAYDRSGATAVEFAIVAPALILCLFGIFNLGLALYSGAAVRNAVQRASRTLIMSPGASADSLRAAAVGMLTDVPVQNLTVSVAPESVSGASVKRVSWTYSYTLTTPFLPDKVFVFDSSLLVAMPQN